MSWGIGGIPRPGSRPSAKPMLYLDIDGVLNPEARAGLGSSPSISSADSPFGSRPCTPNGWPNWANATSWSGRARGRNTPTPTSLRCSACPNSRTSRSRPTDIGQMIHHSQSPSSRRCASGRRSSAMPTAAASPGSTTSFPSGHAARRCLTERRAATSPRGQAPELASRRKLDEGLLGGRPDQAGEAPASSRVASGSR